MSLLLLLLVPTAADAECCEAYAARNAQLELRNARLEQRVSRLDGKVDRLDAEAARDDGLVIVDYKTGRAPPTKYAPATNARIRQSNFFQLRCYALLLARGGPPKGYDRARAAPRARKLRLLYLGDGDDGGATSLDDELPRDAASYAEMLDATEAEVLEVWQRIAALVEADDPAAFEHCSRGFCTCHDMRPLVFPRDE